MRSKHADLTLALLRLLMYSTASRAEHDENPNGLTHAKLVHDELGNGLTEPQRFRSTPKTAPTGAPAPIRTSGGTRPVPRPSPGPAVPQLGHAHKAALPRPTTPASCRRLRRRMAAVSPSFKHDVAILFPNWV